MMRIEDLTGEEVVFSTVWAAADFLRDGCPFHYELYITRKMIYLFQSYDDERFFERKIVSAETLGTVTLKDSAGFSGPHCILLDVFYKHHAEVAFHLSFDNTKEGRILSESIFSAVSNVL